MEYTFVNYSSKVDDIGYQDTVYYRYAHIEYSYIEWHGERITWNHYDILLYSDIL